jgi:2-phospho-L-lactate guanylyltransferase
VWSLVIPVKRLSAAKTRLAPVSPERRRSLALAFVRDCVTAALAAPQVAQVLVVTADPVAARRLSELGARIALEAGVLETAVLEAGALEPAGAPDAAEPAPADASSSAAHRLNAAISFGAGHSRRQRPDLRVGALTGDLPALRPEELAAVLEQAFAIPGRSFVPDAAGTGTTLLLGARDGALEPRFGPHSRSGHARSGAVEWTAGASLRQDVDTLADLEAALRLGVGAHTAHEIGLGLMQGTVRSFDPATRGGTVLLDDGTELPYDAAAFDAGGLRLARIGQRVALRADAGGRITALTLATLPLPE